MSSAYHCFASRDPALFLLQVMDDRGVWRTRKRLGCVVAALSEVAGAPVAYAGWRLRLVEVGRVPGTGATVHREVLRAGGNDGEPLDDALGAGGEDAPAGAPRPAHRILRAGGNDGEPLDDALGAGGEDARALVSALRGGGDWAQRRPQIGRGDRPRRPALYATLSLTVLLMLGAGLLGDVPWATPDAPSADPSPLAAAAPVVGDGRSAIELIGAALAREPVLEPAAAPPTDLAFGVSWHETLADAKRSGLTCREAGPAVVACELGRRVWLHDARSAQLLFDRRKRHLAAVLVVSRLLIDRGSGKDGREIKRRFAEIKGTIDGLLPPGYTASVRADGRAGVPFWSSLRAADGQGGYAAYWTADADAVGPTVSLRLYGIDADRGFYKLLVERPS